MDLNRLREIAQSLDMSSDTFNDAHLYDLSQELQQMADDVDVVEAAESTPSTVLLATLITNGDLVSHPTWAGWFIAKGALAESLEDEG